MPLRAAVTSTLITIVLSLDNVSSATAFNGVISMSNTALLGSHLTVATLLLYKRLDGVIRLPILDKDDLNLVNDLYSPLVWRSWHIPELLVIVNILVDCV